MRFEERVAINLLRLNDVEDDIVDYLRDPTNRKKKIRDMAADLFIAPNTIFRLAKKLGYSGFAQMMFALENEERCQNEEDLQALESLYEPEVSKHITRTIRAIDKKQIKLLLQKIVNADTVISFGVGDTRFFSELLVKYLRSGERYDSQRIRILCDSEYSISRLKENDVAVLISVSGESDWIIDLAKLARQRGAFCAGITMDSDNTLRKNVDFSLTFSSEDINVKNFIAPDLTGLMILLRYIANMYWNFLAKRYLLPFYLSFVESGSTCPPSVSGVLLMVTLGSCFQNMKI